MSLHTSVFLHRTPEYYHTTLPGSYLLLAAVRSKRSSGAHSAQCMGEVIASFGGDTIDPGESPWLCYWDSLTGLSQLNLTNIMYILVSVNSIDHKHNQYQCNIRVGYCTLALAECCTLMYATSIPKVTQHPSLGTKPSHAEEGLRGSGSETNTTLEVVIAALELLPSAELPSRTTSSDHDTVPAWF